MGAIASQITSVTTVCSTVYSGADQRKHQSSASLAFVRGIHRGPVNSPHKGPVTRKSEIIYSICIHIRKKKNQQTENVSIWWRHHVKMNHVNFVTFVLLLLHYNCNMICFKPVVPSRTHNWDVLLLFPGIISNDDDDTNMRNTSNIVHPCEKVIGIFFRHNFFTIYFSLLVLVFTHNICEVVNINSVDFCWISIAGYISVTFWKKLLCQYPMSH